MRLDGAGSTSSCGDSARFVLSLLLVLAGTSLAAQADSVTVPLDQQIDVGLGNAITPDDKTPGGLDRITFETEGGAGFLRFHLVEDNGMAGYYLGPSIDLLLAGIGILDLSQPDCRVAFDARYYQDPVTNTSPYSDAPVFVELVTDLGDRAGTQAHYWSTYEWMHIEFCPATYGNWYTGNPNLDLAHIAAIGFWGTDWSGTGDDYVDFRNLTITSAGGVVPEPATLSFVGLGIGLLALRRRSLGRS